ncbi:MAG: YraN family protein [Pseudomonadota bacterium]
MVCANWRTQFGEADIIAIDRRALVIVEIKTRDIANRDDYPAIAAVNHDKRERLRGLVRSFLRNHAPICRRYGVKSHRRDVIEVYFSRSLFGFKTVKEIKWHRGLADPDH